MEVAQFHATPDAVGPTVIVVPTAPHTFLPSSGVWWDVAPAEVSDQPWIAPLQAAHSSNAQP